MGSKASRGPREAGSPIPRTSPAPVVHRPRCDLPPFAARRPITENIYPRRVARGLGGKKNARILEDDSSRGARARRGRGGVFGSPFPGGAPRLAKSHGGGEDFRVQGGGGPPPAGGGPPKN